MIVRRKKQRARDIPRKIVRRKQPVIGERQKAIVKRKQRGVAAPPPSRGPRFRWPSFGWRPGRGTAYAAILAGFVTVLGTASWTAYQSPFFEISNVEVRGNQRVAAISVAERTGLLGERIFTADLAAAQRELHTMPLLSSVRIERSWPDTVVVHVEERQPWGIWEQGGVAYTIDREGVVISLTEVAAPGSPVIVSSEQGSRLLGDRVDYQAVDATAEIYELLPRQLGTTVTEVAFVAGKGVQVTTGTGQVALLGDSSGITYKLAVWAAVSTEAQQGGIAYNVIDLRYGNRPVLQ